MRTIPAVGSGRLCVEARAMDKLPRQRLREAIAHYGTSLGDNPHLCEAWLNDTCGEYKGEISLLVAAAKAGVVTDLITSGSNVPRELLLRRHVKQLEKLHFTEPAARWGVESWALALGIVSDEELSAAPAQAPDDPARAPEVKADRKSTPRVVYVSVALAVVMLAIAVTMVVLKLKADETAAAALAAQSDAERRIREIGEAKANAEREARKSLDAANKARETAQAEASRLKQEQQRIEIEDTRAVVGDYGVTIYATFQTYNLESTQCFVKAYIYDEDGDEVASSTRTFTPPADDSSYTDVAFSMSSSYQYYVGGEYTFKVVMQKAMGESEALAESAEMPLED